MQPVPESKLTNAHSRVDFRLPGVWEELAEWLDTSCEARPGTIFGHVECEPGWNWRPRFEDYDLWLVARARGSARFNDKMYVLEAGTLLCLRPGDEGFVTQDPHNRMTVIFLHFDFYPPGKLEPLAMNGDRLPSRCIRLSSPASVETRLARAVRLVNRGEPLARLDAKHILQQVLIDVYRQDAIQQGTGPVELDPRIELVMDYVQTHPSNRLTLPEAASRVGLSADYFSRLFAEQMGTSYRAYVLQVRMERAWYLLRETEMPVSAVALALGYADRFLFSRQFTRYHGSPPSRVRR